MKLQAFGKTDKGKKRSLNEDAYYADSQNGIFVVADGMGGHKSGEKASRLVVETIIEYLSSIPTNQIAPHHLVEAVKNANRELYEKSKKESITMGSTVVVGVVKDEEFLVGHVGDSRAYYFDGKRLTRLTDDHSNVFGLVKKGKLTEEEARVHPWSNLINRALGFEDDVEVEIQSVPYSGETILLCTDGLSDMIPGKEIEKMFLEHSEPGELTYLLVERANEEGGKDNITAVLIRKP